jgi:stage II sporulation protein M
MAVKKKEANWKHEIHELFADSWNFLVGKKKFFFIAMFLFIAGSLIGFMEADLFGEYFKELIKEIAGQTYGLDFVEMFWFIFSNNLTSSLVAIVLGVFFGIFPIFHALFNGTLLGYVYFEVSAKAGWGVIWRLLPHGIFELPAIFISIGLGIYIGSAMFYPERKKNLILRIKESLKVFLTIIFSLLVIAAFIESFLISFVG